jgi:hypothetical protein
MCFGLNGEPPEGTNGRASAGFFQLPVCTHDESLLQTRARSRKRLRIGPFPFVRPLAAASSR